MQSGTHSQIENESKTFNGMVDSLVLAERDQAILLNPESAPFFKGDHKKVAICELGKLIIALKGEVSKGVVSFHRAKFAISKLVTIAIEASNQKSPIFGSVTGSVLKEFGKDYQLDIAPVTADDFFSAVTHGDLHLLKALCCCRGEFINQVNSDGNNILAQAVINQQKKIVDFLLTEKKVNDGHQNTEGKSAFHLAAISGNEEIFRLLIQKSSRWFALLLSVDNLDRSPLHYAVKLGHLPIVQLWTRVVTPLEEFKRSINLPDKNGFAPIHMAVELGNLDILACLLNIEAIDINNTSGLFNVTPLHLATELGNPGVVRFLLAYDEVDVNKPSIMTGVAPLHVALEKYGSDLNSRMSYKPVVQLLMNHPNIDINLMDKKGRTPLYFALRNKDEEHIDQLLNNKNIDLAAFFNLSIEFSDAFFKSDLSELLFLYLAYLSDKAIEKFISSMKNGSNVVSRRNNLMMGWRLFLEKLNSSELITPAISKLNDIIQENFFAIDEFHQAMKPLIEGDILQPHLKAILQQGIERKRDEKNTKNFPKYDAIYQLGFNISFSIACLSTERYTFTDEMKRILPFLDRIIGLSTPSSKTARDLTQFKANLISNYPAICDDMNRTIQMDKVELLRDYLATLSEFRSSGSVAQPIDYKAIMHLAVESGSKKVVRFLLDKLDKLKLAGIDQYDNNDNNGQTPLYLALANGHEELVKALSQESPPDFNQTNAQGETPLHYALCHCNQQGIHFLLSKNALIPTLFFEELKKSDVKFVLSLKETWDNIFKSLKQDTMTNSQKQFSEAMQQFSDLYEFDDLRKSLMTDEYLSSEWKEILEKGIHQKEYLSADPKAVAMHDLGKQISLLEEKLLQEKILLEPAIKQMVASIDNVIEKSKDKARFHSDVAEGLEKFKKKLGWTYSFVSPSSSTLYQVPPKADWYNKGLEPTPKK